MRRSRLGGDCVWNRASKGSALCRGPRRRRGLWGEIRTPPELSSNDLVAHLGRTGRLPASDRLLWPPPVPGSPPKLPMFRFSWNGWTWYGKCPANSRTVMRVCESRSRRIRRRSRPICGCGMRRIPAAGCNLSGWCLSELRPRRSWQVRRSTSKTGCMRSSGTSSRDSSQVIVADFLPSLPVRRPECNRWPPGWSGRPVWTWPTIGWPGAGRTEPPLYRSGVEQLGWSLAVVKRRRKGPAHSAEYLAGPWEAGGPDARGPGRRRAPAA